MANRLAGEKSPYLLQHADNPVDWRPWGEDAFADAKRESKPIFLSIGYSTCHWCHVMAHESFENAEIAAIINRDFIPIKVDREERPDVDRVYMTFVQATTGSGGWPMSVWLTPDLEPFYGGTYFPPQSRWNMPGFPDLLQSIARAWATDRLRVVQSAQTLVNEVRRVGAGRVTSTGATIAGPEQLAVAVGQFKAAFDARRGGFGDAPKFPRPSELLFLLREHARTGEAAPRDMVLQTLRAMALGGMRDHIGGGFHRYSVDGNWRVPHFEKMLYDQAQLVLAYLEGAQASGDPFFAEIAEDTLRYVARELRSAEGGFYSAEDADSVPPGHGGDEAPHAVEGAFYAWSAEELRGLLSDDFDVFALRFGIEENGNAPFDPHGEFTGLNLLHTARSIEDVASKTNRTLDDVAEALSRARLVLYAARVSRPRPHLDDKVLAAWNGLMIAAFARASRVLRAEKFGLVEGAERHLEAARRAARFVRDRLWRAGDQTLLRRYRDSEAAFDGYAEDYASMAFGLLELFQATGEVEWLDWADTLQQRMDERFWDAESGGWFSTTGADPSVLVRLKEDYDGPEPSAGALASLNILTLSNLLPEDGRMARVERALGRFGERLGEVARVVPLVAAAVSTWTAGVGQVVVSSTGSGDESTALCSALAAHYLPFIVAVPVTDITRDELAARLPFIASLPARDGAATAYVCRNFVCQAPASSGEALESALLAR
jgi:uncharacterized protein YyaL (SSP411 family)